MSMLESARLDVSLENNAEVFQYFERDPNPLVARLGHLFVSLTYKPIVTFQDGAEDQIREAFSDEKQAFINAKHSCAEDVQHLPAILQLEDVFSPMITKTNIYGKAELISGHGLLATMQRILFTELGIVPVFRNKAVKEEERTEKTDQLLNEATRRLINLGAEKLDRGFHGAIFGEGERDEVLDEDKRNPDGVRSLKSGFARMINRSQNPTNIFLVNVGFSYPELPFLHPTSRQEKSANHKVKLHPDVYIPRPIFVTEENRDNLVSIAQQSLRFAVTSAKRVRELREYAEGCNDGTVQNEIYGAMDNDPDFEV